MFSGIAGKTGTTGKIQRGVYSILLAALAAPILAAAQAGIEPDTSQKVLSVAPGAQQTNNSVLAKTGEGRTVTGRLSLADTNAPMDSTNATVTLQSGVTFKMLERLRQAKTQEDRLAVFQSDEYQKAIANPHRYAAKLADDYSFKLQDVEPGDYELDLQFVRQDSAAHSATTTIFTAPQEIVVPEAAVATNNAPVDLGTIKLQHLTLPEFSAQPDPK